MKRLKVAVIGVGYLGQFHAEKYAALPDVELIGVVDADANRGSQIANKLQTLFVPDAASVIDSVDAVSIVVPTALHHQTALPFLERGIHVLLEKPVTVTLAQADELIAVADRAGAVLQIGHIERFNPALTAIRPLLAKPAYITAERSAPFTVRCTDVNVILDLMIHDLDIVCDLAGSQPAAISAAGASVITSETDMATARILFENGCAADVIASRVSDEKKRLLRVFDGDKLYTGDYQTQKATVSGRGGTTPPELMAKDISAERRDTLNEEIKSFLQSIRTGARPLVSAREGRRALALATQITDSIIKGTTAFVPFK